MFWYRNGGDGSWHLPVTAKLATGFERLNYFKTKELR